MVVFFLFNSLVFNRENVREKTRTFPKMSRESSPPQHSVLLIHLHLGMEFPKDFWAGNISITRGTIPDSE